ncbi:hypothetical protein BDV93DRAFT_565583 [Ceratobasidium sp. AG-I]|nr:hypothetical protein BDV93DRAFT_565583 [Ceratobasidium sp. AG-I]
MDDDNMARPKRSRKPTERGVYVDSATEKTRRTREGNKQKKELAAEANSQTYSADHGVNLMFDLAEPTPSSNRESDGAHLKRLIAQVAHLTGRDYSEECWRGLMGIEDLEAIVDDPTANMEDSTSRLGRNTGKGKAVEATPRNSTNYSGIGPKSYHYLLESLTQSLTVDYRRPGLSVCAIESDKVEVAKRPNRPAADLNLDPELHLWPKKRRAEGGSTSQSNRNPSTSTLPKQPTPAAQAAKGKYPPLGKTDRISFGGRVQAPSATIIGNYHAPSAPHSRPSASSPSQPQTDARAVGTHTIKKPALSSSGGSRPSASAVPLSTSTRVPTVPTKTTFAPSPLRIANTTLAPPSHLTTSNAASSSQPNHTTPPVRPSTSSGSAAGSRAPPHPPPAQQMPNIGRKEQTIKKGPALDRLPTPDDLPRPENIEFESRKSKQVQRPVPAIQNPINHGSCPNRARRMANRPAEEQVPARAVSLIPGRRVQTPPQPQVGEQPDVEMEDNADQGSAQDNVSDGGTALTHSSVRKVLNPNKPAFDCFHEAVQPVLKIAAHKAKARMIACGTYNYLESDPGEAVPTDDVIVAEAWANACRKESVNLTFQSTYYKYAQQRLTTWRHKTKTIIKALVDRELGFSNSRAEENIRLVKKLLPEDFHTGEKGSLPYHSDFLLQACYEVAFSDSEAVGVEFPRLFNPLPVRFIAYVCAIINHVIFCYRDGYFKKDEHLNAEQQRQCFYQYLVDLADREDSIPTVARNHRAAMHDACRALLEKSAPARVAEELKPKRDWGEDTNTEYVSRYDAPPSSDDSSVELINDGNNDGWRIGAGGYREVGAGEDDEADGGGNDDGIDQPYGGQGRAVKEEYGEMQEVNQVINTAEEEDVPSDIEMNEQGEEGAYRYGGHEGEDC